MSLRDLESENLASATGTPRASQEVLELHLVTACCSPRSGAGCASKDSFLLPWKVQSSGVSVRPCLICNMRNHWKRDSPFPPWEGRAASIQGPHTQVKCSSAVRPLPSTCEILDLIHRNERQSGGGEEGGYWCLSWLMPAYLITDYIYFLLPLQC